MIKNIINLLLLKVEREGLKHYEKHHTAGWIKVAFNRTRDWMGVFNSFLLAALAIKSWGWSWWYLIVVPFYLRWLVFDMLYILPRELDYIYTRSKTIRDIAGWKKENVEMPHRDT